MAYRDEDMYNAKQAAGIAGSGYANTAAPTPRQPSPIDRAHAIMESLQQLEHAQIAIYEKLFGPMVEPGGLLGKDGPGNLDQLLVACCQKLEAVCSKAHQINAKL